MHHSQQEKHTTNGQQERIVAPQFAQFADRLDRQHERLFRPKQRIQELNVIDHKVLELITEHAAQSVQLLNRTIRKIHLTPFTPRISPKRPYLRAF